MFGAMPPNFRAIGQKVPWNVIGCFIATYIARSVLVTSDSVYSEIEDTVWERRDLHCLYWVYSYAKNQYQE